MRLGILDPGQVWKMVNPPTYPTGELWYLLCSFDIHREDGETEDTACWVTACLQDGRFGAQVDRVWNSREIIERMVYVGRLTDIDNHRRSA